ncbi:MAG: hypothetical protein M0Z31_01270 [Clostridia bacterium]|nr:hypothetical protein [Clostridia bacterium]
MDFRTILLIYFPVMSLAAYSGLALLGIRIKLVPAVLAGITAGTMDYFVRMTYVPLGIPPLLDLPLMVLILAIVLKFFTKESWMAVTGGSILSYILISVGDLVIFPMTLSILGITIEQLVKDIWLALMAGYANSLLLIISSLLSFFYKFKIIDLSSMRK